MADDVWKKIIDDTRGMGITYRPFLINEPLADTRLEEIMRYIRQDPTARIELNSNGELMKESRARKILEIGIDVIRFSVDGFTEETYNKSRVGISFDRVMERVPRFLELNQEIGGAKKVEVRMIGMEETYAEAEDFKAFWSGRGADVIITDLYVWPWEPEVNPVQRPCKKMLDEMFFYVNGKATLCCWDSNERGVVGDVTKNSVMEIWEGEVNRHYRQLLAEGRRKEILLCSKCEAYKGHSFEGFPEPAVQA